MASEPSMSEIKNAIRGILRKSDLTSVSAKTVRKQLAEEFDMDFTPRKKEIDKIMINMIPEIQKEQGIKSEESETEEEDEKPPSKKSKSSSKESKKSSKSKSKSKSKREPESSGDELEKLKMDMADDDDPEALDDEELARRLQAAESRTRGNRACARRPTPRKPKVENGEKKRNIGGYGKEYTLSESLSDLLGVEKMARNQVVKEMYRICKERDLLDPKNKQFMLCDDQLTSIFGKKRVRMFGMIKELNNHFLTD